MMSAILLLEDDEVLGETLLELLESNGYRVTWTRRGDEAVDATYAGAFDLYVFDINVPDINGLELLEDLRRAEDRTPTIFISALVDLKSIAKGFSLGADDYIKKPFYPEELLIRVNAKLSDHRKRVSAGRIAFEPESGQVFLDDSIISLGEKQHQLLERFIMRPDQLIEKAELMEELEIPSDSALRVAINKLKQTTGLNIRNIRGSGYLLETR